MKHPWIIVYLGTCKAGGKIGKGRARSRKKAKRLACLDIIQQFDLVPKETFVHTMALDLPALKPKRIRAPQPIIEYTSYLRGNYKGALHEYARKNFRPRKLIFKIDNFREGDETVHVVSCTTIKGKYVGRGRSNLRKRSAHLACLDYMFKSGLLTKEQHLEKHPNAAATEKKKQDESNPLMEDKAEVAHLVDATREHLTEEKLNEVKAPMEVEYTEMVKQDTTAKQETDMGGLAGN